MGQRSFFSPKIRFFAHQELECPLGESFGQLTLHSKQCENTVRVRMQYIEKEGKAVSYRFVTRTTFVSQLYL